MTPEEAAKLREPFPPEVIGKLPKVNCKACTEANKQRFGATCDKHQKQKCGVCDNWITTAHIHLDYVGHAACTDRLLKVDPEWTWEFVDQYPLTATGLWIKLTICGVSRYGFGDGKNPKEMIGDAIRNAAMRFGVGLDLWAKEDLHASESVGVGEGESRVDTPPAPAPSGTAGAPAPETVPETAVAAPLSPARERVATADPSDEWHPPAVELHDAKSLSRSLIARKISVYDARMADKLPKLDENLSEADFRLWQKLLADLDTANPLRASA